MLPDDFREETFDFWGEAEGGIEQGGLEDFEK